MNTNLKEKLKRIHFLPIYQQVADYLREVIRKGIYPPGSKLPPEPVLAEEMGISRMPLRKALQILTEEGLIVQRKGKGTFVNFERKSAERKTIGVMGTFSRAVINNRSPDPYFSLLLQGIKDKVEKELRLLIFTTPQESLLEFYHHHNLEGIIIITPSRKEIKSLNELPLSHIPHVIVGASFRSFKRENYIVVDTDNVGGAYKAVKYLIDLGHTRIAFIGGNPLKSHTLDRLKGYKKALREKGIEFNAELIFEIKEGDYKEEAYKITEALLKKSYSPTAIFAGGFSIALGVMKAVKDKGLSIPEDISVVGYDEYELGEHFSPSLTTVRQPIYELGERGGEKILEQFTYGRVKERWTILPTELVIRESCGKVRR